MLKNLNKHIGFAFFLCLGVFLIPSISYACAKNTASTTQKSCSKAKSTKAKEDCCKTKSHKKDNKNNECADNCKHSSCGCSTSSSSVSFPLPINLKVINPLAETKKQKFGFKQAYYSSCYYSIWQPPKIG